MKQLRILNVYKWATMGGVERVFLNRAHAFKEYDCPVIYDIYFMYDSGGLTQFKDYIKKNELGSFIQVVDSIDEEKYDFIFSVDTPEIFDMVKSNEKVFIECHTAYKENRAYIRKLPQNIAGIIVPSNHFRNILIKEVTNNHTDIVFKISNAVIAPTNKSEHFERIWNKKPMLYLGRMDKLKNVEEVIEIFSHYKQNIDDQMILVLVGHVIKHELDLISLLDKYQVRGRTIIMPPIAFENVHKIFEMVRNHRGLFISSSTQETFGLSAAEAICSDIPVILSDIVAHNELVSGDNQFLYTIGNIEEAVSKLAKVNRNYNDYQTTLKNHQSKLQYNQFIEDWNNLMSAKQYG
jgi:glycosyltransferase involved in cell wall biosynthesis